jgi:AcrR family transcriptional regulator
VTSKDVGEGRPPRLTKAIVIGTAIEFIDEHGLPGLSMRRLGERLGVEAMAIYHHVPSREALLDGVVEVIIDEMRADPSVLEEPQQGWQHFLVQLAHGVRRIALDHPRCFPLVAARPPEAPWLRPPLRSLYWVETFLNGLRAEGFGDDAAVDAYRAFTSFLLGHLLLEVSLHDADVGPLDVLDENPDQPSGSLEAFPSVRELQASLSADKSGSEFEESLEHLLSRITLMKTENGTFTP